LLLVGGGGGGAARPVVVVDAALPFKDEDFDGSSSSVIIVTAEGEEAEGADGKPAVPFMVVDDYERTRGKNWLVWQMTARTLFLPWCCNATICVGCAGVEDEAFRYGVVRQWGSWCTSQKEEALSPRCINQSRGVRGEEGRDDGKLILLTTPRDRDDRRHTNDLWRVRRGVRV
jgi:hypothetical protein